MMSPSDYLSWIVLQISPLFVMGVLAAFLLLWSHYHPRTGFPRTERQVSQAWFYFLIAAFVVYVIFSILAIPIFLSR